MTNLRKPCIHPELSKQLFTACGATSEVAAVAEHLAGLMRNIHGGTWRVQLDHSDDTAFVLIVPKLEKTGAAS